jgi:hypothetical protein
MKIMTAIAEQLRKLSVHPRDVAFDIAISKYLNSGGTIAGMQARLDTAAARMPGMGRPWNADEGRESVAQTRQPNEDDGAIRKMPLGHSNVAPSSSPNRGGEGQTDAAHRGPNADAAPVRDPKPQRAAIDFGTAAHAIKTKLAQTVLDRIKTSDGRAWGDVGAHELDGMSRDGALAQAIKDHIGMLSNTQRFKTIRELVKPETFDAIRSKVHGA